MQRRSVNEIEYHLSIRGFRLQYTCKHGLTVLRYDPFATCALFVELKLIQGFDVGDEPVIVMPEYEAKKNARLEWYRFVTLFVLSDTDAQKIAAHHYYKMNRIRQKQGSSQEIKIPLLLKKVLPPHHLYTLHNYYHEHIQSKNNE